MNGFFSEEEISVLHQKIYQAWVCVNTWDNFQQAKVTGRIKEVCSAEMLFEVIASSFHNHMDRNPRGVGGHNGARLAEFIDLFEYLLFDVQAFDDGFQDPVAIGDFGKIVIEITSGDPFGCGFVVESSRLAFDGSREGRVHQSISDLRMVE